MKSALELKQLSDTASSDIKIINEALDMADKLCTHSAVRGAYSIKYDVSELTESQCTVILEYFNSLGFKVYKENPKNHIYTISWN